jgi:hypothetical protein
VTTLQQAFESQIAEYHPEAIRFNDGWNVLSDSGFDVDHNIPAESRVRLWFTNESYKTAKSAMQTYRNWFRRNKFIPPGEGR